MSEDSRPYIGGATEKFNYLKQLDYNCKLWYARRIMADTLAIYFGLSGRFQEQRDQIYWSWCCAKRTIEFHAEIDALKKEFEL